MFKNIRSDNQVKYIVSSICSKKIYKLDNSTEYIVKFAVKIVFNLTTRLTTIFKVFNTI